MRLSSNQDAAGRTSVAYPGGVVPVIAQFVFLASAGTVTVYYRPVHESGRTGAAASFTVTTAARAVDKIVGFVASMVGLEILEVSGGDLYHNTGIDVDTGLIVDAPSVANKDTYVPAGNYQNDPWRLGVVGKVA